MKILFIHSLNDPTLGGGGEVILWEQIRGFLAAGHRCSLLTTSDKSGLLYSVKGGVTLWTAGIRNIYWPYQKKRPHFLLRAIWHLIDSYNPLMQGFIRKVLNQEHPDVVIIHGWTGWSVACISTIFKQRIPIIQILHGHDYICAKSTMFNGGKNCSGQCISCRALRIPHRSVSNKVDAVVGVSKYILKRHESLGYFNKVSASKVIHNCRSFIPADPKSEQLSENQLRFGYIGRLDEAKGVEFLIEEFKSANLNNCELLIAGSGKSTYEAKLRNKAANSRIHFLGYSDAIAFYSKIDVLIVPSLCNDNFPGAVLEALSSGKPVIGSRRGGIPEMIKNGINGLLFEPNTKGELSDLLRMLAEDDNLLSGIKVNTIPSSYCFTDTRTWIQKYEELCKQACSSTPT